jgi:hypothetical protein
MWLPELAHPASVVVSAATWTLVQGYFVGEMLGRHCRPGTATPVPVYRILCESGARNRLEGVGAHTLTPFVGRERECALLQDAWMQTVAGHGQVVLLSGEAGIGKSRLVQVSMAVWAEAPLLSLVAYGSPYHQQTAFYPVIDLLQRWLGLDHTPGAE